MTYVYVSHAEMTDSRHKFGKLFTLDGNSYEREDTHPQNST